MSIAAWFAANRDLVDEMGILFAVIASGAGFWVNARVERAKMQFGVIRDHREVWLELRKREYEGIFAKNRDAVAHPPTDEEIHGVNLLLNHLLACYNARRGGIYVMPECVEEDIQGFFALPVPSVVWQTIRRFHDRRFVKFVEKRKGASRPKP